MYTIIDSNIFSNSGQDVRVVLLSDTHEYHRDVTVPDGDLLIHAGDITQHSFSSKAVQDFDDWLSHLPHRYKVVTPGNHDYAFADQAWQRLITSAVLLINDGVEIMGLKMWGTPVTPVGYGNFGGATAADRRAQFGRIPEDTDLLISHGPPYGILDRNLGSTSHEGCRELLSDPEQHENDLARKSAGGLLGKLPALSIVPPNTSRSERDFSHVRLTVSFRQGCEACLFEKLPEDAFVRCRRRPALGRGPDVRRSGRERHLLRRPRPSDARIRARAEPKVHRSCRR